MCEFPPGRSPGLFPFEGPLCAVLFLAPARGPFLAFAAVVFLDGCVFRALQLQLLKARQKPVRKYHIGHFAAPFRWVLGKRVKAPVFALMRNNHIKEVCNYVDKATFYEESCVLVSKSLCTSPNR